MINFRSKTPAKYCLVATAFCLPVSTAATNIFFVLTALLSLNSLHQTQNWLKLINHPVARYMLGFALLFFIGIWYSQAEPIDAWARFSKHLKFVYAALFLWLFRDKTLVKHALTAFMMAMTLWLILSYLKIAGIISIYEGLIGHGVVFKSHIHASYLLSVFILVTIARYQMTRESFYISCVLIAVTLAYLCFFSTGRSGYIIVIVLLNFIFYRFWHIRGLLVSCILTSLCCVLIYQTSPHVQQRIKQVAEDTQHYQQGERYSSVGLRMDYFKNGLGIIKKSPWFGTGTGSVKYAFSQHEPNRKFQTNNPHNEYINIAIQLGLLGLMYLLIMFAHLWYLSFRLPTAQMILSQGIIIATMVGSCANSLLMDTTEGHTFVYFTALAFAALNYQKQTAS